MGEYTEMILGCALKSDVPDKVLATLRALGDGKKVDRIDFASPFVTSSSSFPTFVSLQLKNHGKLWMVNARGNLKNYHGDIEKFLAWLEPYVEEGSGGRDCYAITFRKSADEPKLFCLINEKDDDYR